MNIYIFFRRSEHDPSHSEHDLRRYFSTLLAVVTGPSFPIIILIHQNRSQYGQPRPHIHIFCETQWPRPPLFSPSWLIQWSMGEGSYITLFLPSDVTAFHRMKYGGRGVLYNLVFTEWRHCVSQNITCFRGWHVIQNRADHFIGADLFNSKIVAHCWKLLIVLDMTAINILTFGQHIFDIIFWIAVM